MGIMEPILQEIITVDRDNDMVMVKSAKGNIYPVSINRYVKSINVGDNALVVKSNVSREWLMVDVEPKTTYKPLDVSVFPRDSNGDLNVIEHCKYLQVIEGMSESEKRDFDNYLLNKWGDSQ
jgi:hypothetical protein